jgi:hypothetical protein
VSLDVRPIGRLTPRRSGDDEITFVVPPRALLGQYDGATVARFTPNRRAGDAPRPSAVRAVSDLHWADPETLAVLEYLGDHIADTGVLLLATLRSGEGDQA